MKEEKVQPIPQRILEITIKQLYEKNVENLGQIDKFVETQSSNPESRSRKQKA